MPLRKRKPRSASSSPAGFATSSITRWTRSARRIEIVAPRSPTSSPSRRQGAAARPSAFSAEAGEWLAAPPAEEAVQIRKQTGVAKALLVRSLRAAREDGDECAAEIRRRLADLAARELEREIAFGKATGIDPDGAKGRSLAEVLAAHKS